MMKLSKRPHRFLFFTLCALPPLLALYCLAGLYVDFFFWDEWNLLVLFSHQVLNGHSGTWAQLWEPHFSHRVVLLKALSVLNFLLLGGNQLPLLLLAWFIQLALLLLLVLPQYRNAEAPHLRRPAIVSLSLLLFSPAMILAWLWPVCLSQLFTSLFFCLTMLLIPRLVHGGNIITPSISALACSFSSGTGLAVWPAALLLGALIGVPWRKLAAFAALGALTLYVYFSGMPVEEVGEQGTPFSQQVHYFLAFLGSPFRSAYGDTRGATIVGVMGLVLYATVLVSALKERNVSSLPALSISWLSLAAAAAGAQYRIGLGGVEQALVDRYIPLILPFWAGLVLGVIHQYRNNSIRLGMLSGLTALFIWTYLPLFGPDPIDPRAFQHSRHSYVRLSYEALQKKVFITSATNPYVNLFPFPDGVLSTLSDLKQVGLGPFRPSLKSNKLNSSYRLGKKLSSMAPLCEDCPQIGELTELASPYQGLKLCSHGYEKGASVKGTLKNGITNIREILIFNEEQKLIGKGFPVGQFRFPLQPNSLFSYGNQEHPWVGFVSLNRVAAGEGKITAFAETYNTPALIPLEGELVVEFSAPPCQT